MTIEEVIEKMWKIYLDELAESERIGKEEQWKATEKAEKKTSAKIKELEKENAELKKENKELKQHNEELDTFDRTQSYKLLLRIDELKAVIRSMMNEESKYTLDELEKLLEDK